MPVPPLGSDILETMEKHKAFPLVSVIDRGSLPWHSGWRAREFVEAAGFTGVEARHFY